MALTHLADTSVLTRLAREDIRAVLRQLMSSASVGRSTISDLEIGASARNSAEWDTLMRAIGTLVAVDVEPADIARAGRVQRALASEGRRERPRSLLIAAAAERRGLIVLHHDKDFELIAGVTHQPHAWVVPRGSVN